MWNSIYKQADAALFPEQSANQQQSIEHNAQKENNMTTLTAIRDLDGVIEAAAAATEAIEATSTCACGARAVVSNEDRDSCVTCVIHQWMQPEEIVAPTNEERQCVECGGAHLPLYDVQSHCGLCVEAMTSEEYEATAMATAEIAMSVLIQTWECGLCDDEYILTTAVQRTTGLCPSCVSTLYGEETRQEYDAVQPTSAALIQDVGDDPDYLYQQMDDIHGVPVERSEDTDLSRAVTRLLEPEDLASSVGALYHRDQCVYCQWEPYDAPGCPGISA